jgi:hypothetical protein
MSGVAAKRIILLHERNIPSNLYKYNLYVYQQMGKRRSQRDYIDTFWLTNEQFFINQISDSHLMMSLCYHVNLTSTSTSSLDILSYCLKCFLEDSRVSTNDIKSFISSLSHHITIQCGTSINNKVMSYALDSNPGIDIRQHLLKQGGSLDMIYELKGEGQAIYIASGIALHDSCII